MSNEQNPIDELFRNGLKDGGITPPPGVWESVSAGLPAAAAPGLGVIIMKSAWTWVLVGGIAVSAVFATLSGDKNQNVEIASQTISADPVEEQPSTASANNEISATGSAADKSSVVKEQPNPISQAHPLPVAGNRGTVVTIPNVSGQTDSKMQESPEKPATQRLLVEEHHAVPAPPCGRNLKVNVARRESDNVWIFSLSSAPSGAYYAWSYGDGESGNGHPAQHEYPDANAEYAVKVMIFRSASCMDSGMCRVVTRQRHPGLSIPDVFTPNGDGINDELVITLPAVVQFNQIVTDRNGRQVFVSDDPNLRWNGKSASVECQPGTYRVTLTYRTSGASKPVTVSKSIFLNR